MSGAAPWAAPDSLGKTLQVKYEHKAAIATAAMFFGNGFSFATWVSRIPGMQQKLALAPGPLGLALLALGVGALFSLQTGGHTAEKFGSRSVTFITLLLTALALSVIPYSNDLIQLCAVLGIFGIFSSSMDIAMNAHGVAVQRRLDHPVLSSMHAMWSVGGVAGAGLGSWMVALGVSPQVHFGLAAAMLVVLAVVARSFMLPRALEFGKMEVGASVDGVVATDLQCAQREATAHSDSAVAGVAVHAESIVSGRESNTDAIIWVLAAVCFLAFTAEGAVADWSALYLQQCLHTSIAFAPLGFCAFSFAMSGGRFAGDIATKRFGADNMLRYGSLLAAVGIALVVSMAEPSAAIAGFVIAGIGMATIVPVLFSTAGNVNKKNTASSIGKVAVAGYVGLLIGPPILGFAAQAWGLQVTLIAVSAICLAIFLLAQSVDCTRGCFE